MTSLSAGKRPSWLAAAVSISARSKKVGRSRAYRRILELRAELERYAVEYSRVALHDRLRQVDPVSAERIHPNNTRRVIRALEVQMLTGTAISALQAKRPPPYRIYRLGLQLTRDILYERVDARVEAMIAAGLVEEVSRLLDMGYDRTLPSMSGLGYREIAAHLLDGWTLAESDRAR